MDKTPQQKLAMFKEAFPNVSPDFAWLGGYQAAQQEGGANVSNEELQRSFLEDYRKAEEARHEELYKFAIERLEEIGIELRDGKADLGNGWSIVVDPATAECRICLRHKDQLPPPYANCERCMHRYERGEPSLYWRVVDLGCSNLKLELGRHMHEMLSKIPSMDKIYALVSAYSTFHEAHKAEDKDKEANRFIRRLLGLG
jgi:hypothetical protein